MVDNLRLTIAEQAAQIEKLKQENQVLKSRLQFVLRRLFGRASEKLDSRQLELTLGLKADPLAAIPKEPKSAPRLSATPRPKRERKPRLPEDLPTEEVVIEPEEVKANPAAFRRIGEEVTQELDYVPPKYFRRLLIRPKYVSLLNRELAPLIAELPPRLIEGSFATPALLSDILVRKYVDHLPLHRQAGILRTRYGIELSRKTMCDWVRAAADWLGPIYRRIGEQLRQSGYLQADETPIVFSRQEGGGSGKGYLWVCRDPKTHDVLFEWHTSRGAECLNELLKGFKGTLQTDGYVAYETYAGARQHVKLAGCWAHARRKFFEAKDESAVWARWILHQIGLLYRLEARLREPHLGPAGRRAARAAEASMILARLKRALTAKAPAFLPQSGLGKAVGYALKRWPQLEMYRDDGRIEIDNNGVENAIRPTAIGKKNWLFIGHPEAGDRSAIIYTILENCRRCGINPQEYLQDVLERMPSMKIQDIEQLLPARWAKQRKARAA